MFTIICPIYYEEKKLLVVQESIMQQDNYGCFFEHGLARI